MTDQTELKKALFKMSEHMFRDIKEGKQYENKFLNRLLECIVPNASYAIKSYNRKMVTGKMGYINFLMQKPIHYIVLQVAQIKIYQLYAEACWLWDRTKNFVKRKI